jgi:hypothetical protein
MMNGQKNIELYISVNYCMLLIPYYTFSHYTMSVTPPHPLQIYEALGLSIGSFLPVCDQGNSCPK